MSRHIFCLFAQRRGPEDWLVDEEDAFQAAHVLRLAEGDAVEICDGAGYRASARVTMISKKAMRVACTAERFYPPPTTPVWLALGALKQKDFFGCLPQLVELGVDRLWIFGQEGIEASRLQDKNLLKAEKVAREALKVSKGAYLPKVHFCDGLEEVFAASLPFAGKTYYGDPEGGTPESLFQAAGVFFILGGERGLLPKEVALIEAQNFEPLKLSTGILRATTCAEAAAAIFGHHRLALTKIP